MYRLAALCLVLVAITPATARTADTREDLIAALMQFCIQKTSPGAVCSDVNALSFIERWQLLQLGCGSPPVPPAADRPGCDAFRKVPLRIAVYDVRQRAWTDGERPLSRDVNGVPTFEMSTKAASDFYVAVTGISPVVYSATAGEAKSEPLPEIKNMQEMLTNVGKALQLASKVLATVPISPPPKGGLITSSNPPAPPPPLDRGVSKIFEAVLARRAAFAALRDQLVMARARVELLDRRRSETIARLQALESGSDEMFDARFPPELGVGNVAELFTALQKAVDATAPACIDTLEAYAGLFQYTLDDDVPSRLPQQVTAQIDEYRRRSIACGQDYVTELNDSVNAIAAELSSEPRLLQNRLAIESKLFSGAVNALQAVPDAVPHEKPLLDAYKSLAGARDDLLVRSANLERALARVRRWMWAGRPVRTMIVARQNPSLKWSEQQQHTVVIKADNPYQDKLLKALPADLSVPYRMKPNVGSLIGIGTGLVYTPLYESTWTATTRPGGTDKVVTETGRSTRAGDLAMFVTYRVFEHVAGRGLSGPVSPHVEFGVGLTSGTAAFFTGGGVTLFKALRITGGLTTQRVKVLNGQEPGVTVVASNEEIKTREEFENDKYIAISFALESLRLFGGSN